MPVIETPTAPITLLDAVNMLLEAVKLASVMSLVPAEMDEAASEAVRTVGWSSRQVQLKGWNFNTLDDYRLEPNVDGEIVLPENFTLVVPTYSTPTSRRFTKRGNRLFNLTDNSFVWDSGFPVRVVQTVEFEQVPEPIRWYITAMAGRKFGIPRSPETSTFRFTEETVRVAEKDAQDYDAAEMGVRSNLKWSSPHHYFMSRRR